MGFYDRDYYRDEPSASGFHWQTRTMVTNLVILNAGLFLVDLFVGNKHWLVETLSARTDILTQPWLWWKFVTYGFAHNPQNVSHVFWNMVGLWIFGRDVEDLYGRREFLRIYLTALILGSVFWCLREHFTGSHEGLGYLRGASGAVTAITLLFVFHFPYRTILLMFVLPVPAWLLGVLMIGGDVLQVLSTAPEHRHIAFDVHLVGAAFAIAYYRLGWNLGRIVPDPGFLRYVLAKFKRKPRLKVHNPDTAPPFQEEDGDRILEKVGREGIDSLTPKERRILEEYSRRMRQKYQ